MSIRLPFVNHQFATSGAVRLDAPTVACEKPASVACVYGLWVRPPSSPFVNNRSHTFLGQQGGGTGGNDGYVRFADQGMTTIEALVKDGGTTRFSASVALGAAACGKAFLVMVIVANGYSYLAVCEPGGAAMVGTHAGADLYARNLTGTKYLFNRIGSALDKGFYGEVENAFFLHGSFPGASTGAPDTTLIQNIASGAQDLDTLHTLLTGGSQRFRYTLANDADLADAWGVAGALTPQLINAPTGFRLRPGGPLRPVALRPAHTRTHVSQAQFPTPGSAAGATARIRTEGGIYAGITPAAIEARLVKDDGAELLGWTTVDAAPAGGAWAAGELTGVPLTVGFLRLEFRAVDGGGLQVGPAVSSHGLRGTGFSLITSGQSQHMHLWEVGASSISLPAGINLAVTRQKGVTVPAGTTEDCLLSSGDPVTVRLAWGMRQAAVELNTRFPGIPVQFATVGESGQDVTEWQPGGAYANRWGWLRDHVGMVQDHYLVLYGHSNPTPAYLDALNAMIPHAEASLGQSKRVIMCPTARYSLAGTNNAGPVYARNAMWDWVQANPARGHWGGSWAVVHTSESAVSADPHPGVTAEGQGRSGALIAWAVMMAARAAEDVPLAIKSAEAAGTSVTLRIGPVN
ncbi:hypothetical protein [Defluviimonas salinarum]|uniref:Sialate O-acetylesterase domain-containing protein n=1 Tax=Defluviimonas salinarum TaxID=2992147 RepID=A0ABT3JA13_9RHOB|nr:hypothetical protein [Defluviimonas salinarum]MCW3784529.1 hypothetical protein [Defluviimonas salinarum]